MKIALYNLWSTSWSVFKPLCETTKNLTHEFRTMFHTYTPWKRHKIWDQRKRQKPDVFRRYRNGKLAWYGSRPLPLSWRRPLSYGNQSIDLRSKFLYDNGLRHERVKKLFFFWTFLSYCMPWKRLWSWFSISWKH